ncbi:hypothetical protein [Plasticicumulans sp.]|uniref:hypothetical protein n=1 Tax=Plasticicumulans sp. TaxID=2307179 RepID=UPI002BFC469E|nr:hypothetical protein [Plasticicumulans sp.]HNM44734.1 hypothetical protein [Plasticicumulans sp.]
MVAGRFQLLIRRQRPFAQQHLQLAGEDGVQFDVIAERQIEIALRQPCIEIESRQPARRLIEHVRGLDALQGQRARVLVIAEHHDEIRK